MAARTVIMKQDFSAKTGKPLLTKNKTVDRYRRELHRNGVWFTEYEGVLEWQLSGKGRERFKRCGEFDNKKSEPVVVFEF